MEALEFTALIKDRNAPEVLLQILYFCLVGEARAWMREFTVNFQEEDDRRAPSYAEVRAAFLESFPCVRDADALWRELCALQQSEHQAVDEYRFIVLWNRWQKEGDVMPLGKRGRNEDVEPSVKKGKVLRRSSLILGRKLGSPGRSIRFLSTQ